MGARPLAYVLALALPATVDEPWLARFAGALGEDQRRFAIALAGGDVVATPGPLTVAITALGEVEPGLALRRSGATPGEAVFVSGSIGDAALGLRALQGGLAAVPDSAREALVARHRLPEPRVALGQRLAGVASAAIDVSDGLVADLGHVCEASGVGAELRAPAVPLSEAARLAVAAEPALLARVLTGGDDYELLFTVRPSARAALAAAAREAGVAVSEIGVVTRGEGVHVLDADGAPIALASGGYEHF
jgi:thiamine-monophosphate kinase